MQSATAGGVAEIGKVSRVILEVSEIVASIAAAIEEQDRHADIAQNIAEASGGVADANTRVSESSIVSREIARDIAELTMPRGKCPPAAIMCAPAQAICRQLPRVSGKPWADSSLKPITRRAEGRPSRPCLTAVAAERSSQCWRRFSPHRRIAAPSPAVRTAQSRSGRPPRPSPSTESR